MVSWCLTTVGFCSIMCGVRPVAAIEGVETLGGSIVFSTRPSYSSLAVRACCGTTWYCRICSSGGVVRKAAVGGGSACVDGKE